MHEFNQIDARFFCKISHNPLLLSRYAEALAGVPSGLSCQLVPGFRQGPRFNQPVPGTPTLVSGTVAVSGFRHGGNAMVATHQCLDYRHVVARWQVDFGVGDSVGTTLCLLNR